MLLYREQALHWMGTWDWPVTSMLLVHCVTGQVLGMGMAYKAFKALEGCVEFKCQLYKCFQFTPGHVSDVK